MTQEERIRPVAHIIASIFTILTIAATANAQTASDEPPPFTKSVSIAYTLRDDGLMDKVATHELFVGSEQVAGDASDQELEFRSFYENMEILEAATLKADGRKLTVATKDIAFVDKASDVMAQSGFTLDTKVAKLKLPDVGAGDRIRIVLKYTELREWSPGGQYEAYSVDPANRYTRFEVSLDAPVRKKVHTAERDFSHKVSERGGRVLHEWSLTRPLKYRASEANQVLALDNGPYMMFSTFADWHAVGNSMCSRAEPLVVVTPEIARLAAEITRGKISVRDQAQAIHEWVIANIRYVNIVLGAGGLVPRSVPTIVSNRFGDCKDHSTLIRTLLAAKGIDSEYAYINSGRNIYKAPPIPQGFFDHVIVYIPELKLYLDGTAKQSGFASLPETLVDRPVLRCGSGAVTLARVPPVSGDDNRVVVDTEFNINSDGTAQGRVKLTTSGSSYDIAKGLSEQADADPTYLDRSIGASQRQGSATITAKSFDHATSVASVNIDVKLTDSWLGQDNSAPTLQAPGVYQPFRTKGKQLFQADRLRDFVCIPVSYRETVLYRLPPGWRLETMPQDIFRKAGPAEFSAHYSWADGALKIERAFDLRTSGSVCPAAMAREIAPVYNAAIRSVDERLTFVPADGRDEAKLITSAPEPDAEKASADVGPVSKTRNISLYVHSDHRIETTIADEVTVNTQAAAEQFGQNRLSANENEQVEILEAATLKADGRRLEVPAEKIFDYTIKTIGKQRVIVFPDVAVGDRLRTVSRTIQKQPEIQGGFFLQPVGFVAFGDASAHVTLDAPTDMKLHISTKGLGEKITKGPVRTRYEWDVIPTPYKRISTDLLFLATYTARLQISSFADWQTAGQAYCSAVGLATTVTPDIAALAKQITSGKSGRINQAKAIFDWLDENITESDIPNATLTPKPASVTLSARHGDASDVAVLLHALLTASGIEAYPVRSDDLRLTDENDVPNPSLGTAIVYLPEFDLYADPKPGARKVAFGVLNEERYGRQALRCGPKKAQLIRMPTASADTHTLTITTNITVSSEGVATGTSTISARGSYKSSIRSQRKSLRFTSSAVQLEEDLRKQGLSGAGQLTVLAPGEDEDSILKTTFSIDGSILGEDNALPLIVGPRFIPRSYSKYAQTLRPNRNGAFFCFPDAWQETVTYQLPAGWKPKVLPKDVERRGGPAIFIARYTWRDNRLKIERRFEMRSESSNCPATMATEVLPVVKAASRNDEERLTFIPTSTPVKN